MLDSTVLSKLLKEIEQIAILAGKAVMEVYRSDDFDTEIKGDGSPLTRADTKSHEVILKEIQCISGYNVISEEGQRVGDNEETYWLIDPLDGTKEFIKRNGEFTVNIALIHNESPVLGVVYAPDRDVLYAGAMDVGAYKIEKGKKSKITSLHESIPPIVVTSRSHRDDNIEKFIEKIGKYKEVSVGSSLKLCLIAEGQAALYPRLAPTHIWDTAAADAVVRSAGGVVCDTDGNLLKYNLQNGTLNPFFIVGTKKYINQLF